MLINHSPHYLLFGSASPPSQIIRVALYIYGAHPQDGTLHFGYFFYCRDQPKLELYIIVNSQIHFSDSKAVGCKQVVVTRLLRFCKCWNLKRRRANWSWYGVRLWVVMSYLCFRCIVNLFKYPSWLTAFLFISVDFDSETFSVWWKPVHSEFYGNNTIGQVYNFMVTIQFRILWWVVPFFFVNVI